MTISPIFLTDAYKLDHRRQYPIGTTLVESNLTPRGSRIPGTKKVIFFGLQYFLKKYLTDDMGEHFFSRLRGSVVDEYRDMLTRILGPSAAGDIGIQHIADLHDLGYVPLSFDALPEGTACPLRVPMVTYRNTHPNFFWLTNYIETLFSSIIWLPCTSATTASRYKKLFLEAAMRTGGDPAFVPWQGHDFSSRGMAACEASILSGAGHATSFSGSDVVPVLNFIDTYYGTMDGTSGLIGSVAASEHSVMCAGNQEGEVETFKRLLSLYKTGIVSIVSDTWDLWNVVTKILPSIKDQVMSRDGKLVIRPDSGDPVKIICGDPDAPLGSPAGIGLIECLWNVFGGSLVKMVDGSRYRKLDPHIGAIYGDAITYDRAGAIIRGLERRGFTSDNVVLGIGSFTYNYVTRDTHGFAVKSTYVEIDGAGREIFKRPVTDSGEKFSAKGRLMVLQGADGELSLKECASGTDLLKNNALLRVWRDGRFIGDPYANSFTQIRDRVNAEIDKELA